MRGRFLQHKLSHWHDLLRWCRKIRDKRRTRADYMSHYTSVNKLQPISQTITFQICQYFVLKSQRHVAINLTKIPALPTQMSYTPRLIISPANTSRLQKSLKWFSAIRYYLRGQNSTRSPTNLIMSENARCKMYLQFSLWFFPLVHVKEFTCTHESLQLLINFTFYSEDSKFYDISKKSDKVWSDRNHSFKFPTFLHHHVICLTLNT